MDFFVEKSDLLKELSFVRSAAASCRGNLFGRTDIRDHDPEQPGDKCACPVYRRAACSGGFGAYTEFSGLGNAN